VDVLEDLVNCASLCQKLNKNQDQIWVQEKASRKLALCLDRINKIYKIFMFLH